MQATLILAAIYNITGGVTLLLVFGVGNLIFAALFTYYLLRPQTGRVEDSGKA